MERSRAAFAAAEQKLRAAEEKLAAASPQPADPGGKTVLPELDLKEDCKKFPAWDYTIRLPISFGYETNPTGLSRDLPRPAGLAHKSSTVTRLNPSLRVTIETNEMVTWLLRYDLLRDFYHERSDINTDNHTFIVNRKQKFNDGADVLGVTLRDDLLRVDEEGNANQFSSGPEWEHKWGEERRWSTIVKYSFNINDFALSDNRKVAPVSDPDSTVHVVGIAQKRVVRPVDCTIADDKEFTISLGYEHSWQNADGNDLDRQRSRLTLDAEGRPFPKSFGILQPVGLEVRYRHDFDNYAHRNSGAGAGGFQFERDDNIDDLTVVLSYPLSFGLAWKNSSKAIKSSLAATYHYDRRDSNITGQDKDNHAIRLGVIADF